jgi:hypothetical protein
VNSEFVETEPDVYLKVGLWRKEKYGTVCYKEVKIESPFVFTKHAKSEENLVVNREKYYIIPDKVLAVGPNNDLFYFKINTQSDWVPKVKETYKHELLKMI